LAVFLLFRPKLAQRQVDSSSVRKTVQNVAKNSLADPFYGNVVTNEMSRQTASKDLGRHEIPSEWFYGSPFPSVQGI
jgi:hypothetical protein